MGPLLRLRGVAYGEVMLALMFVTSSCSGEQGGLTGEGAGPETREVTRTVTVAEAPKEGEQAAPEPGRNAPARPPAAPPDEQASVEPVVAEDSPEDVLALQYRLINAGDYDGAYALFAERSKALVTPEQYGAYFGANAPYSIKDYSFPSVDAQGDAAIVEVALTANSASGPESYQRAQELVLEDGAWRVVMRDDQASAFIAGAEEIAQYGSEPPPGEEPTPVTEATPEPSNEDPILTPEEEEPFAEPPSGPVLQPESTLSTPTEVPPQYETPPSSGGSGLNCDDFDFQEDAQAFYDQDPSDPEGLDGLPGDSFTGVQGVACEELPSRGEQVPEETTEPEQYE